jgi:alpha-ketoglutarate-dependent taurine dioxygenase
MREWYFPGMSLPCVLEPETHPERDFDALARWIKRERAGLWDRCWRHGAVLFRGFELFGAEQFAAIARIMAPDLIRYTGGDAVRDLVGPAIYTSTRLPPDHRIPLHNEKSYSNGHPAIVLFYCDHPPSQGGATPLLDGRILLSRLDPRLVETFERKKVRYVQNLPDTKGLGKSWQETFESSDHARVEEILRELCATFWWKPDGTLHVEEVVDPVVEHPGTGARAFFSQADRWHVSNMDEEDRALLLSIMDEHDLYHSCTFGDGSQISENLLDQIRSVARESAVRFSWQARDLLLLDNRLTLHARDPYYGKRRILVAMA